jgi:signal transduction histidine kinase
MASATDSMPALPPDPLSLKRRLMLQGGGFALLLLLAFSGTLYWGIALQRGEDQRSELRQLAATAAAQLPLIAHETREAEGRAKFRSGPGRIALPALAQQRVQWFDSNGRLLSEQGTLAVPAMPAALPQSTSTLSWQQWTGGVSLVQVVQTRPLNPGGDPERPAPRHTVSQGNNRSQAAVEQRIGFVRVALSDGAALADLERLRRGLLLGGIVTALAALLVGRHMLRAAFLPLQQQVDVLQRFTADASHELRHPLTALRTLLAAVPEDLRQHPGLAWPELKRISRRMGELLEDLLTLARLQQSGDSREARPRDWHRFDLLELLEDLIRCYAPQAAARAITLRLSPKPEEHSIPVEGDSEELLRLFTNLLLNAIRHSPEGGTVALQVSTVGGQRRVAVTDQGPGIPSQDQEQVFDRFWSGADRGSHSGLGLAIGRAIARRHGGELRLGESRPGRCVLLVDLPAAVNPPQTS